MLASLTACAGEDEMAPFYNGNARDDGGVNSGSGNAGNDDGPNGMAGEPGSSSSGNGFLGRSGMPANFDPAQVYLRGAFVAEHLNQTDARAEPCSDAPSAIPDWSSPDDDRKTSLGVTAATTCESRNLAVRVDGSIVYTIGGGLGMLFVEDKIDLDGSTVVFNMGQARPHDDDITLFNCQHPNTRFRYWLHSQRGEAAFVCWSQDDAGVWQPEHHIVGDMEPFAVPSGYTILHLGIQGYVLLREVLLDGDTVVNRLAVWNRKDDSLVELELQAFSFERIYTMRATPTGFLMLVVDSSEPVALSRWEIAYDGALVGPLAPAFVSSNHRLDNSTCDRVPFGVPSDENPEFLPNRGCMCALEASEAAVCIAEDVRGDQTKQVVLRFDAEGSDPEVVFDPADNDIITRVTGLFTGD